MQFHNNTQIYLETKRREEPLVLSRLHQVSQPPKKQTKKRGADLKLLLKALLDSLLGLLPLRNLLQILTPNLRLQLLNPLEGISRRHEVIVIDGLEEGFHFTPLGDALLAHSRGDFAGVALDAGDEGVAVRVALCAVIEGLEDDGFAAGVASARDEGDLAGFQDCQVRRICKDGQ
jgi:hypothetical protein